MSEFAMSEFVVSEFAIIEFALTAREIQPNRDSTTPRVRIGSIEGL